MVIKGKFILVLILPAVLCAAILMGSVLAADTTRQVSRELPLPDDTKIVAPILKSSSGALYGGGGQAPEGEMNGTIKVKDIREALNARIEPDKPLSMMKLF